MTESDLRPFEGFLAGVPDLFDFCATPTSDFLGLPLLFTGEVSSPSFSGTVVVVVVVRCLVGMCEGDACIEFSWSEKMSPSCCSTVTLIFHGLDPRTFGVCMTTDFDGETSTVAELPSMRTGLLHPAFEALCEVLRRGLRDVEGRLFMDEANGSGDESGYITRGEDAMIVV